MKWIALLMFGGIGLAGFIGGGLWGASRYALYNDGLRAQGQVVENFESVSVDKDKNGTRRQSISYYPVVEFQAPSGKNVRFRGSTGSSVPDYQVGTPVPVIYAAANPYEAQIESFSQLWLGPVVVFIAGFITLAMGVGGFVLIGRSDVEMERARDQAMRDMRELSAAARKDPRFANAFDEERALVNKHGDT